jgi:hypothetical protein
MVRSEINRSDLLFLMGDIKGSKCVLCEGKPIGVDE